QERRRPPREMGTSMRCGARREQRVTSGHRAPWAARWMRRIARDGPASACAKRCGNRSDDVLTAPASVATQAAHTAARPPSPGASPTMSRGWLRAPQDHRLYREDELL